MHQIPNSQKGSGPLQAVFYARRSPTEPPMMVTLDLKPYTPSSNSNAEYVQLTQPLPANPSPIVRSGQPHPQQNFLHDTTAPTLFLASERSYDNMMPASRDINEFSLCSKIGSGFLILCNLAMTVSVITFIFLALLVSTKKDEYTTGGMISRSFALSLGFAILLIRLFFVPCFGWSHNIKTSEKVGLALNFIMPALKYHIIRLNPSYVGKMKTIYRQDVITIVYQLVVGICSVITFSHSYHYDNRKDPIWLLLGVFCLINVLIQIAVFIIHIKWIKQVIHTEQRRAAALLMNPLLEYQQQPYLQPYPQPPPQYFGNPQIVYAPNQPNNLYVTD